MTDAILTRDKLIEAQPVKAGLKLKPKLLGISAAIIIGAGALTLGAQWWTSGRFMESTDDAYVGGEVTVMAPKVSGFISRVLVTDNQIVKAGDLLIQLDDSDYQVALAKAEAAVQAQKAAIDNLDAERGLQLAVISQARAGVVSADAGTTRAHLDNERYKILSDKAFASVQLYEKSTSDYKQAAANSERSRAELSAAQSQLAVIATQRERAVAGLASAIADRDMARLNVGYTQIRAPIGGAVGNRSARTGSYAPAGAQLVSIVPQSGLWVDANFKEGQLEHMKVGQPVTVKADVLPGHVFKGHVISLSPATGAQFSILPPENATGNFTKIVQRVPVRIALEGETAELALLRPGLSVKARIDQKPAQKDVK